MKGITFERERRGYSIEQVDAYIDVLQDNYKKVASSAQNAEAAVTVLKQKLVQQKENSEVANRQFEEEKKELKRRFRELEAQLKAASTTNTAEQEQQLEQQQLERKQLEQQQQELKQQLESQKTENSKLNQQVDKSEQEIKQLQDQIAAAEEEKSSWQEQLKKLTEENRQLKAEEESGHNQKTQNMPEHLTELYTKAQEQADAYVEQVKRDMETERVRIASERKAIIAQAEADARKIEEAARQAKYDEFEKEKERLRKEQEEQMAEIAYLKQEAEAERASAKEESESMIRQAWLKLNLAEEKDKIRMEKALSKSRKIETQMEEQYQQMHSTLIDSAKRLSDLFEYVANINEAKSVEEIRKYGDSLRKEKSNEGNGDSEKNRSGRKSRNTQGIAVEI